MNNQSDLQYKNENSKNNKISSFQRKKMEQKGRQGFEKPC